MLRNLTFSVCLLLAGSLAGAQMTPLPDDSAYVTVKNGHLMSAGKRVRLWCVIGGFPNESGIQPGDSAEVRASKRDRAYRDAEALIRRFQELGFNGIRFWRYSQQPYTKGDGSREDVQDYFVLQAKKAGFRIWKPAISVAPTRAEDVGLIDEPATGEAWQQAVREGGGNVWIARIWDPRLEAAQREVIRLRTQHMNLHTGLKVADDPVYAIWELTNEEWWMMKMVGGTWQQLPKFFQDSLFRKWNEFLREKYQSDARLIAKWGFLLPGENLAAGTVKLAPTRGPLKLDRAGMDPQARLQLEQSAAVGIEQWGRDDFSMHRGADVLEFFTKIQLEHKKRLRDFLKPMGKSTRLGPVIFDTGIGYEIQSQWMHQNAEAVSHNAYINGFTVENKAQQRWPWYSGLEEWPRISQDVPWLEHNRVEGKPFLCYETQIMQPGKYRAEYPYRLLALAAIQDWCAIAWHYWGSVDDITTNPRPFDRAMDMTTRWHPQGYHFTFDAVQNAMMRAAAHAFRNGHLKPAPKPTTFTYGRRSLFDPASMDYGKSYGANGTRMLPTTYQYGVRILIDPNRPDDAIQGPTIDPLANTLPNRVSPHEQIEFDVARGGLKLDAPGMVGFAGFFGRFGERMGFRNGITLSEVKITVPNGMPYADGLTTERYLAFGIAAHDALPLAQTRRATLSLVSTSFNTGFKLLMTEQGLCEPGTLPVLEARVSALIQGPALAGMRYRVLDWHSQVLREGRIGANGAFRMPMDLPVWVVELSR